MKVPSPYNPGPPWIVPGAEGSRSEGGGEGGARPVDPLDRSSHAQREFSGATESSFRGPGIWRTPGICHSGRKALSPHPAQPRRSDAQHLRSDTQRSCSDAQRLGSHTQALRSDAQHLRSDTQRLRSDTQRLRSDTQRLRSHTQPLRSDAQRLRCEHSRCARGFLVPSSQNRPEALQIAPEASNRRIPEEFRGIPHLSGRFETLGSPPRVILSAAKDLGDGRPRIPCPASSRINPPSPAPRGRGAGGKGLYGASSETRRSRIAPHRSRATAPAASSR